MTPTPQHTQEGPFSQTEFQAYVRAQMQAALRVTLTAVLEEKLTALIGAERYEQTSARRDQRNGYYQRNLLTSVGPLAGLAVPPGARWYQDRLGYILLHRWPGLDE